MFIPVFLTPTTECKNGDYNNIIAACFYFIRWSLCPIDSPEAVSADNHWLIRSGLSGAAVTPTGICSLSTDSIAKLTGYETKRAIACPCLLPWLSRL